MYKYNDYLTLTKEHLRNYVYYKQAVINLTADVADIRNRLSDESIKTSSYGPALPGGAGELNGTEHAADDRIKLREEYPNLAQSLNRICMLTRRLQENIKLLSEEEREAVELFYFQRLNYSAMSRRKHLSERSCRRLVSTATRNLALMMYGLCAQEDIIFVGQV